MATTANERFWKYLPKNRSPNKCWIWQGYIGSYGYGRIISHNQKVIKAHRLSYERHKGEIPSGLVVRHTCDNPSCVNPNHLLLGTHTNNATDKAVRRRAIQISDKDVRRIFKAEGTYRDIANDFRISPAYVCLIKNQKVRTLATGGKIG